MKCPTCGTHKGQVLSTRPWQAETMLQRRRECANGHRFSTYEIQETLYKTLDKYAAPAARGLHARGDLWVRDTVIVAQIKGGRSGKEVAHAFGIAPNTVSWILKRRAPELTRARKAKEGT